MADRLFVAVIGSRNSGKSTTWNTLFGHEVRTGKESRRLWLDDDGHTAEVFLISGSNEERKKYAAKVLADVDCRAGTERLRYRVEEIRQFIHGWALARGLVV